MRNSRPRTSLPLRTMQVLLGLVTASFALVLGGLLAIYVNTWDEHPFFYLQPAFWILSSLVLYFSITSFRLLTGRGASNGDGLLSAVGYCIVGGLVVFTGVLVVGGLAPIEPLRAGALGLAFLCISTACFSVAWRRAHDARASAA